MTPSLPPKKEKPRARLVSCSRRQTDRGSVFLLKIDLDLLGQRLAVLVHEILNALNGVEQRADGLIVIQGINEVRNVLAHVYLNEPGLGSQFGATVDQVGGKHAVKHACLKRGVKFAG